MTTTQEIETAVREIVSERPDYIYDNAGYYLHKDEEGNPTVPGCLLGHALLRVGYTTEQLQFVNSKGIKAIAPRLKIEGDLKWLNDVQILQDSNITWANAVRAADSGALNSD